MNSLLFWVSTAGKLMTLGAMEIKSEIKSEIFITPTF